MLPHADSEHNDQTRDRIVRFYQHQDQAQAATRRLLLLFLLTVLATVLAVNLVLALLWTLHVGNMLGYPRWFFETNSVVCAVFILGGSWIETMQLRQGGAHVARMVGGRELLAPRDGHERRLRNVVEEMAIASGLKPPRIFVLDRDDGINAFAAGWEQNDSVVAVTRGALQRLSRDELQGVVAHEFSHILQGDARLNMRLIGYVWGLQLLFLLGRDLFDITDANGRRTAFVPLGLALMAVGSIGWLAGRLLKAAVSRQREFLADAAAVQFTRQRDGIGGALRKIAGQRIDGQDTVRSSRAEVISHMLLSSHIFQGAGALATHPPVAERIRRIYGRPMAPLPSAVVQADQSARTQVVDMGMAFDRPGTDAGAGAALAAPSSERLPDAGLMSAASTPTDARPVSAQQEVWPRNLLAIAWPHDLVPATLAFLVPRDDGPQYQTWCALFAVPDKARPDHVLRQAWAMPARARQGAFERLLTRCASLPASERKQVRQHAHRIVRADGRLGFAEIWHCLLLHHVLEPRRESVLRETDNLSLPDCARQIAALTDLLAARRCVGQADLAALQLRWRGVMATALGLGELPMPVAAQKLPEIARVVQHLARLSWMLRPRLMKAWCALVLAAAPPAPAVPQALADALRALCLLIDTPMPPDLQAHFAPGAPQSGP